MNNDIAMCRYHGITMHNDIAMNLLCIIVPIYVILLWIVWNKNKNKFVFDQSGLDNTSIVFVKGYSTRPSNL